MTERPAGRSHFSTPLHSSSCNEFSNFTPTARPPPTTHRSIIPWPPYPTPFPSYLPFAPILSPSPKKQMASSETFTSEQKSPFVDPGGSLQSGFPSDPHCGTLPNIHQQPTSDSTDDSALGENPKVLSPSTSISGLFISQPNTYLASTLMKTMCDEATTPLDDEAEKDGPNSRVSLSLLYYGSYLTIPCRKSLFKPKLTIGPRICWTLPVSCSY